MVQAQVYYYTYDLFLAIVNSIYYQHSHHHYEDHSPNYYFEYEILNLDNVSLQENQELDFETFAETLGQHDVDEMGKQSGIEKDCLNESDRKELCRDYHF